jgi:predicted GNAT family N-acyltransferase
MENCQDYNTQMSLDILIKLLTTRTEKEKSCMYETIDDHDNVPNIKRLLKAEEVAGLLNINRSLAYL